MKQVIENKYDYGKDCLEFERTHKKKKLWKGNLVLPNWMKKR